MTGRLGVLGGTFDPVHFGHLFAAEEAADRLGLYRVLFVPTREPPHKQAEPVATAEQRLAMVRLAVDGNPLFEVCTLELERAGPSYTVDTLGALGRLYPRDELHFIVGMDSLRDMPLWYQPRGVASLARIVAVARGGEGPVDLREVEALVPEVRGRVSVIERPALEISGTELRRRIAEGHPVRYLVPDSVIAYIEEQGLYRI